ncbi:hypothetical protein D3C79_849190 [compost metagenome]
MSASAVANAGMMLAFSPALARVQFTVVPLLASPRSLSWSNWWASSVNALRPSSGAEPACEARPLTSSLRRLMPLVATVTASLSGGS